jgi:hypothetical protein
MSYDCRVCPGKLKVIHEERGFATIPSVLQRCHCDTCGRNVSVYFWRPEIRGRQCAVIETGPGNPVDSGITRGAVPRA